MHLSERGRWIFERVIIDRAVMYFGLQLVLTLFGLTVAEAVSLGVLVTAPFVLVLLLWMDRRRSKG